MVMELRIDVFGETELSRKLLRFTQAVENPKPAFDMLHTQFLHLEHEQFESGGKFSPDGLWAPLADSTVARKAALGLDPRTLIASGRLFKSLSDPNSEDHIYHTTDDSMFIGSRVEYGVYHQSRAPRTRLPRRPPVSLPESEKKHWVKLLQGWLIESFRNAK
jgi:phage gpG-like protein